MSDGEQTYKASGVNIVAGDDASEILFMAARQTWTNRQNKLGEIRGVQNGFRASRFFLPSPAPEDVCFGMNFDGIGTKIEVAERLGNYRGLARDLLAMVCDDAAIQGAEPLLVGSILDMAKVDLSVVRELAIGLVDAAATAGVSVINGELAELPGRIGGYGGAPFNWGASCIWAARRSTIDAFTAPQVDDVVLGVEEHGFRSNGYSLLRKIFRSLYGENWGTDYNAADSDLFRFAVKPSTLYTPLLLALTGGLTGEIIPGLRALIHVTGGGPVGRCRYFTKVHKLGIQIDSKIQPPHQMRDICELGNVAIKEAYRTWNMGIGLIIVAAAKSVDSILNHANTLNFRCVPIGSIVQDPIVEVTCYDGSTITVEP